ncbi:MAG: response regulator transcription factor [Myxococcota bacterium]
MTNQDNPFGGARIVSSQPGEVAAQDLVLVYASVVPQQLEHWLRKRNLRFHLNDRTTVDPNEIRNTGARYVVMDLDELPREHPPIETIRHLRTHVPEARLITVTSRTDASFSRALTEAGAQAVIIKQPYVADLVFALQAAGEGRVYVSGQSTERERAAVQITAREKEVLELMAHGHSNQSIGERLSISVKTVEAHRARLFKKLGASNVADAVLLAIRTGLVMP